MPFVTDVFLESVCDFLRQESNLRLFSAFGARMMAFRSSISLGEFENLTDPHAGTGHEFEHETISGILRPEDDFIDHIFFKDFELGQLPCPEKLSQARDCHRDFGNQDRPNS